jgi:RNA-directed DNA polymerase
MPCRRAQPSSTSRGTTPASGKRGVPQGGVVSPLLANIYLNEVDGMLERAKAVTRKGIYTYVEYARYADDLVILVSGHEREAWLRKAVDQRLREELAQPRSEGERGEEPGCGLDAGGGVWVPGL